MIDGDPFSGQRVPWDISVNGKHTGIVTSSAWSPRLTSNIALAMLNSEHAAIGTQLTVASPYGDCSARVCEIPFPGAIQR